jgi:ABC-type transport system substrate-binding protein
MAGEPKYGGIAIFAHRTDVPLGWENMKTDTISVHHINVNIAGAANMVRWCRDDVFEVCTSLAESWENSDDFKVWTFKIRDDVLWHDGTPLTAEDMKFWMELALGFEKDGKTRARATWSSELGEVEKIEVLAGNRLRVTLGRGEPFWLTRIGDPRYHNMHPRHLMQPRIEKGEVGIAPADVGWVSVGPFTVEKVKKGSVIQIRRFDKYWEKDKAGRQLPYLDGIDFPIIKDPSSMDAAFRVGRLDGGGRGSGPVLSVERKIAYVKDMGDKVWFANIPGSRSGLGLNTLLAGSPFQDVRVRKAVSLWIDKRGHIKSGTGFGELFTLLAPTNPFNSPDFLTWPGWNEATRETDRAEAKRLMAEAGFANGFTTELPCRNKGSSLRTCEYLQDQLRSLGINAEISPMDYTQFISYARIGLDAPLLSGGIAAYVTIPEATESSIGTYDKTPYSVGKHNDPKVNEFFGRMAAARSVAERTEVWRALERYLLLEQVYVVPLSAGLNVVPYRSYVKGIIVPGESKYQSVDYAEVWLDK